MTDFLKNYINGEVGYISDEYYFKAIEDLSNELIDKDIRDDLKLYLVSKRSDFLSEKAVARVKKRLPIFKYYKDVEDGGDNPWAGI